MYVFLDVDGVLNTEKGWEKRIYSLDPCCVAAFCRLIRGVANPKIVLSSSWRNGISRDGTTAVHIDDLINALSPVGIRELDKTGVSPDGSRTKEIKHFLKWHPEDDYIILDDDPTLFDQKTDTPHLYLTSSKTGLTDNDVSRILKLINKSLF